MEKEWMMLLQQTNQLGSVLETNKKTEQFGLTISEDEAKLLVAERSTTLREQKRVEFGSGIITKIIYEFCDSAYINQDNYIDTLVRLQEIFYQFKNEMLDEITDDELLHFMKEQFETICYGDLEYLSGTCLEIFAEAIRAGYQGFHSSDGYGEYEQFDEVERWNYGLYQQTLRELISE